MYIRQDPYCRKKKVVELNIKVRLFYTFESQYVISYFTIVKESPHILYLYNNVNFANVDAFF